MLLSEPQNPDRKFVFLIAGPLSGRWYVPVPVLLFTLEACNHSIKKPKTVPVLLAKLLWQIVLNDL